LLSFVFDPGLRARWPRVGFLFSR